MKVALGTLEIDEITRKKLGKAVVGSSYLKRDDARDWALKLIDDEIARLTDAAKPEPAPETAEDEVAPAVPPITAPKDADSLPEPSAPLAPGI